MYSSKFVLNVLVNGERREERANGEIIVPFGEYSIELLNKHSRRAVAKIFIDEENVSAEGIIVPAYGRVEIKRYVDKDRAFKFVSLKSKEARAAGNDNSKGDKGVIRVDFYLEKEIEQIKYVPQPDTFYIPPKSPYTPWKKPPQYPYKYDKGILRTHFTTSCDTELSCNTSQPSEGRTVEGISTGQTFTTSYVDIESECITLRVFLRGFTVRKTAKERKIEQLQRELDELRS